MLRVLLLNTSLSLPLNLVFRSFRKVFPCLPTFLPRPSTSPSFSALVLMDFTSDSFDLLEFFRVFEKLVFSFSPFFGLRSLLILSRTLPVRFCRVFQALPVYKVFRLGLFILLKTPCKVESFLDNLTNSVALKFLPLY